MFKNKLGTKIGNHLCFIFSFNNKKMKIVSWINEKYPTDWVGLSCNSCHEAIQLLRENPDKINWENLNLSSLEALMLLLEHPEKMNKVDTFSLFQNHHIFDDEVVVK